MCIVSGWENPNFSPTTTKDWFIHFVTLFLFLYNVSLLSRSISSSSIPKTNRLLPHFCFQRFNISTASSFNGMVWVVER